MGEFSLNLFSPYVGPKPTPCKNPCPTQSRRRELGKKSEKRGEKKKKDSLKATQCVCPPLALSDYLEKGKRSAESLFN